MPVPLGLPVAGAGVATTGGVVAPPLRLALDVGGEGAAARRLRLQVVDLGLACCAVEVVAAAAAVPAPDDDPGGPGEVVDVLVVAGTVTDAVAPAVQALWEAMPAGSRVVSFGACSSTGGPYWDSYSVTKGVAQLVPVDLFVPGCPPRPQALLDALHRLGERA